MRVSLVGVSIVAAMLFQAGCQTYPPSGNKSSDAWKKQGATKTVTPSTSGSGANKTTAPVVASSSASALPARTAPVPVAPARVVSNAVPDVADSPNVTVASSRADAKAAPAVTASGDVKSAAKGATAAGAPAAAKAADAGSNAVRRTHLQFKDKAMEKEFLQLVAGKQGVQKKMNSILVLRAEQVSALKQLSQKLADDFNIRPDGSYRYDTQTMTIYEVLSEARGTNAATGKVHLQIKEKAKERQFVLLLSGKKKTLEAIASMDFMVQEKRQAIGVYDARLNAGYSISKDRTYQYDASTKTLYELIPAPAKAGVVSGG